MAGGKLESQKAGAVRRRSPVGKPGELLTPTESVLGL